VLVACVIAFLAFFFFVPISQGFVGDCIAGSGPRQSISFPLIGIGMTYASGHLTWQWGPLPFCW
jgi:hypothetical protein